MVQNRYYHGLKAYIGAFHPLSAGQYVHPPGTLVQQMLKILGKFWTHFGPNSLVADISGHISAIWGHILGLFFGQNWVPG